MLRHSQIGQVFQRGGSTLLSRVRLLSVIWALLTSAKILILSKGMISSLWVNSINQANTYRCKSPVPNSGGHIKEVLSFHLRVFEPAGNIPARSSFAVLEVNGKEEGGLVWALKNKC